MSVAGTYNVRVMTPKGVLKGKIKLIVEGNILKGTLEGTTGIFAISNGKVKGNTFEFVTKVKTPLGRLTAFVTGVVDGNTFSGVAKLPIGSAKIDGTRE